MSEPKVSIIVPVYNVEKLLDRCVNSLTNQTLADIEIILVDDSSTDSSPSICDKLAKEDNRIKVIHKINEGAGKARNAGLQIATGKYVGFVDSDDFVDLNMYEELYNKAEKSNSDLVMSGTVFVGGAIFSKEESREIKRYFNTDTEFTSVQDLNDLKLGIVGSLPDDDDDSKYGMSVWKNLFKREIIVKNALTFESERQMLSEDALFMVDYIGCITKAIGISGAYYNYVRNDESISKSYKKDRFQKGTVFITEVEKRYSKNMQPDEYHIYIDRFWQAFCRVVCTQEIMYAVEHSIKYNELKERLKMICNHSITKKVFKTYPLGKLPLQQAIFAIAIKFRLYLIQKILVDLKNR